MLTTEESNDSRLITIQRWVVEVRNGYLKSIFKFLNNVIQIHHIPNIGDFFRMAGAIINKYHIPLKMANADSELAQQALEKSWEPNVVQALVEA